MNKSKDAVGSHVFDEDFCNLLLGGANAGMAIER